MSPFHLSLLLTLAPLGPRGGVVESPALDAGPIPQEAPELDLHVRGSPLAGETLRVEVRGPLATPVVVLVDQLPAELGPLDARSVEGLLPGSRAARPETRARARASSRPLVLRGTTDGSGLCTWPLTAPAPGTRLLLRGFAASPWPREFEALELDILPRPARGSGTPTITPSSGGPTSIPPGQGVRPCTGREDVPDLDFDDANCDGIDGDLQRAVFVATTGSDANPGTIDLPVASVNLAIQMAASDPARDHVYVSEGVYSGLVTLQGGVSVWGGYSASNSWQRSSAYVTTFASSGAFGNGRVGVVGTNLATPITLGSVTVTTTAGPSNGHNYGILLQSCEDVALEAVTVVAGAGGGASSGTAGTPGGSGSAGSSGSGNSGGNGGGGAHSGGGGGAGGNLNPNGSPGGSGNGPSGGSGGAGGGFGNNGSNGSSGGAGGAGSAGGIGSNAGFVSGGQWSSNGDGLTGGTGGGGSGGGGGGGGGITVLFQGAGGGGGGGGGFGGGGGAGGKAGGSSFALFLSASSVGLVECQLTSGAGRNGGNGGFGGGGGAGGNRGFGVDSSNSTDGGDGGLGGSGGTGGRGGGGGGGHSYAVLMDPESSLTLTWSTLSTSATGAGGAGGTTGASGQAALIKQL